MTVNRVRAQIFFPTNAIIPPDNLVFSFLRVSQMDTQLSKLTMQCEKPVLTVDLTASLLGTFNAKNVKPQNKHFMRKKTNIAVQTGWYDN